MDSKTLEKSLDKLSKRFNIRQVIIVADRGLNSKLNLSRIKAKGYDYIVASRLKKMSQSILNEVFSPEGYTPLYSETSQSPEQFRCKILDHVNRFKDEQGTVHELDKKLIITYS